TVGSNPDSERRNWLAATTGVRMARRAALRGERLDRTRMLDSTPNADNDRALEVARLIPDRRTAERWRDAFHATLSPLRVFLTVGWRILIGCDIVVGLCWGLITVTDHVVGHHIRSLRADLAFRRESPLMSLFEKY